MEDGLMAAKKPKKTPRKARPQKRAFPVKERKIAILGTTPSRMQAPIDDPSWEIWTIGPGGKDAHRWDRLFELHNTWPWDFGPYHKGRYRRQKDVRGLFKKNLKHPPEDK